MSALLSTIASYVPPRVVRTLLAQPQLPTDPIVERFPAAVLFADVSGFTPLAEALEQRGAEGPEELTRLLNQCLSRTIGVIEAEGGEVVEFGGDAVIVLFPAMDDPLSDPGSRLGWATRRALQAAEAVQAVMTELATLQTSIGPISLGIKIGIGAGQVLSMQVGGVGERWDYVVAGDPLRQVTEAEALAQRGDIVLSPEAAAIIHPHPLPAQALEQPDWSHAPDTAALMAGLRCFVPRPVLAWLDEGLYEWLSGLRPMSVLFVGVKGLNYNQVDVPDRLHHFLRLAQERIYRYKGVLGRLAVDDKGTILLVFFGAPPYTHEDDPLRAVRCAQDLVTATHGEDTAVATPLHLAIGVTTGHLFAGPVGGETRREYTVMGNAINLAARLMANAAPGEILCDFDTYRQARSHIPFDKLEPMRVKGKTEPVQVYRPGDQSVRVDSIRTAAADQKPLIGRTAELAQIKMALDALESGEGHVLILEGEAGIGKSRLAEELSRLAQERGLGLLMGAGQSIEQQTPYRAWSDIFVSYFNLDQVDDPLERQNRVHTLVQEIAPDQIQRLPLLNDILNLGLPSTELTATLDATLRQQSLALFLQSLLKAWIRPRQGRLHPLILVLEDAHWLDSLSWELATYTARALIATDVPLLLVLVTRPSEAHSVAAQHMAALQSMEITEILSLDTLSAEETVTLVTTRLGLPEGGLPLPIAELVRKRSGGNPFFAEELVLTLRDRGVLTIESNPVRAIVGDLTQAAQTLPDTVQGLILARIDRLPPERQLVLKMGSVIGRIFPYAAISHTVQEHTTIPDSSLQTHLDALSALDLTPIETTEPSLTYMFKHIITQKVAYETLLFTQRRQLHRTVAEWYENTVGAENAAPLLSHHYHQAADQKRERYYVKLAGEQAAAKFANTEAVHYLSRALELGTDDTERYDLLFAREQVYDLQGARDAQQQDLIALKGLASSLGGKRQAEIALRQAEYALVTGDYAETIAAAQEAITLSRAVQDERSQAKAHREWGRALLRTGDLTGAQSQLERALALSRSAEAGQVEADSLCVLGNVRAILSDAANARSYYEQALNIYREIRDWRGEGTVLLVLGKFYLLQGNHVEAKTCYEQAVHIYRKIGDRRGESLALGSLSGIASTQDDYPGARTYYEQALDISREIGDRYGEGTWHQAIGLVLFGQGDYTEARIHYERALDILCQVGGRIRQGVTLSFLGQVLLAQGDYAQSRDYLERALKACRQIHLRVMEGQTLSYLGLLSHHVGDDEAAQAFSQQGLDIALQCGDSIGQGNAQTILGHALMGLGQFEQAADAYQQARALWRALGWLNPPMEPLAGLARVALAQGNPSQAQVYVEEILAHLETNTLDGTMEPFRVYLSCYRVLQATQDPRTQGMLEIAHRLLQERAAKIDDEELRRSFLENVAVHREIVRAP